MQLISVLVCWGGQCSWSLSVCAACGPVSDFCSPQIWMALARMARDPSLSLPSHRCVVGHCILNY